MITQSTPLAYNTATIYRKRLPWTLIILISALIWLQEIKTLWPTWVSDPAMSHGFLVPIVVTWLLWAKRDRLREWVEADWRGLIGLLLTGIVYLASVFADVDFLKPTSLIAASLCGIWFLGGTKNLKTCALPVGFLVFMIPWPTLFVEHVAFPLQLISSAYSALFSGMLGVPIHRDGVQLFVQTEESARPIFSIVVAQTCSGLTSFVVLLALAYLVAYFTPVRSGLRILMVAIVIPLTIVSNTIRLTIVLFLGSHGNATLAQWVHDNEGPPLICFCAVVLLCLRRHLISRTRLPTKSETEIRTEREADVSFTAGDIEPDSAGSTSC